MLAVSMCKKLLVISDTHGYASPLFSVLKWAKGVSPDAAVFLGDGLSGLEQAAAVAGFSCPWYKARGNNDFGVPCQEVVVFDFGGRRFFACHGHRYGLHNGTETLVGMARHYGADVALFGHTHVPFLEEDGGLLLVNPGSVGSPRCEKGATFALIECPSGEPPKAGFWGIGADGKVAAVSAFGGREAMAREA